MTKNYMEKVAEMLGVRELERFYIRHSNLNDRVGFDLTTRTDAEYCFTDKGLHNCNKGMTFRDEELNRMLRGLLNVRLYIEKIPFEPKIGEEYYTYEQSKVR